MSIDTTFKPLNPSIGVSTLAVQVTPTAGNGMTTVRVLNSIATVQAFCWAPTAAQALALAASLGAGGSTPGSGVGIPDSIYMAPSSVGYFEIPPNYFFCGNSGSGFVFTPGTGGVGG
jgi:hypothetical protein